MDTFTPRTDEFALQGAQQGVVPASGASADDGESKALRELAALGERVSAARLVA
ncbi:MAG: hypothetical protein IT523_00980 [Burkholderiales bacterium]|nr:hypothetical protein [Pseudomonadota bacterium]MCC7067005.1 hypothetical protein [Burkholderiales bacterium]